MIVSKDALPVVAVISTATASDANAVMSFAYDAAGAVIETLCVTSTFAV